MSFLSWGALGLYGLARRQNRRNEAALGNVGSGLASQQRTAREQNEKIEHLLAENAELRLYVAALVKLMIGRKLLDEKELVSCLEELDRSDGLVDGAYEGALLGGGAALAEAKAGTLYSVVDGLGRFRVAKILGMESGGVHICLFANHFPERPERISPAELTMGDPDSIEDRGVPHAALKRKAFLRMEPVLLGHYIVTPDEQDALFKWRDKGGVFVG